MTKATAVARKAPRTPAPPKRAAPARADRRKSVVPAADDIVEGPIDDMVEQLTAAPEQSFAAAEAQITGDVGKQKLVRDSFTMPKNEYQTLDVLKTRLLHLSHSAKKGELLRAGVAALGRMTDSQLLAAIAVVPNLKTGRPKGRKTGAENGSKKSA